MEFARIHQNEQNTDFHRSDHLMLIGLHLVPVTKITMTKFILTKPSHFYFTAKSLFSQKSQHILPSHSIKAIIIWTYIFLAWINLIIRAWFSRKETIRLNQKYLVLNSAEHMKPVGQIWRQTRGHKSASFNTK